MVRFSIVVESDDPPSRDVLLAVERAIDSLLNLRQTRIVRPGLVEVPESAVDALMQDLLEVSDGLFERYGIRVQIADSGVNRRRTWPVAVGSVGLLAGAYGALATEGTLEDGSDRAEVDPTASADLELGDVAVDSETEQSPTATLYDGLEVLDADEEQVAIVRAAVERMEAYGFDLPTDRLSIRFDSTRAACDGQTAFAAHGGEESYVAICHDNPATLIHELTHVWAAENLTDADRQAWVEHRGLDSWAEGEWEDRGSEQLAEIVASGLDDVFRPTMTSGYWDVSATKQSFSFILDRWVEGEIGWWSDIEEFERASPAESDDLVDDPVVHGGDGDVGGDWYMVLDEVTEEGSEWDDTEDQGLAETEAGFDVDPE